MMRRVLWKLFALVVVVGLLALFSVMWVIILLVSLIAGAIVRWIPKVPGRIVGLLILLILVLALWYAGAIPNHNNPGSIAVSRVPGGEAIFGGPPAEYLAAGKPPQMDEDAELRERFRRDVFELRKQENAVRRALDLDSQAEKIIGPSDQSNLVVRHLIDAKAAVGAFVKNVTSIQDLNARINALESYLKSAEQEIQQKKTIEELRDFWDNFRLGARQRSFTELNDQVLRLENEFNQLEHQLVSSGLTTHVSSDVSLDETHDQLIRQLVVGLTWHGFSINRLDLSEFLLDRDPTAVKQEVLVSYGELSDAKAPNNPAQVLIRPKTTRLNIVRRTIVPAHLTPIPTRLRLPSFHSFLLGWPSPLPIKMRAVLDLSATGGPAECPYSLDIDINGPITALRLPANAYYASSYSFKPARREGNSDALEGETDLKPDYFLGKGSIWVELMPKTRFVPVFRNAWVQESKSYLFPENTVVGLIVMFVGAVWAWIFKSSPAS